MAAAEQRCEMTELLVDQCGCAKHRNSTPCGNLSPTDYVMTAYTDASRDSQCVMNEDHHIVEGDRIALIRGKAKPGVVAESVGWICPRCIRDVKQGYAL